jgi:hypothetical protein
MFKRALRAVFLALAWIFRPFVRLFAWWLTVNLGRGGRAVLLPDSMAIFFAFLIYGMALPYFNLWRYVPWAVAALLVSPFALSCAVWALDREVRVVRLFLGVPYWIHRVPRDAVLELFEAWEDPSPSGIAFESKGYRDPLHLGTSRSAGALYEQVGSMLDALECYVRPRRPMKRS